MTLAAFYKNDRVIKFGGSHLRRHEARPDKTIDVIVIGRQPLTRHFRGKIYVHGANGLVRVLGAFSRFINPGSRRQIIFAIFGDNKVFGGLLGLFGHARGVRAHVSYQRHHALVAKLDSLVKFLRHAHRSLRAVTKLLIGRLLQTGGNERGSRRARSFLAFDGLHDKRFVGY